MGNIVALLVCVFFLIYFIVSEVKLTMKFLRHNIIISATIVDGGALPFEDDDSNFVKVSYSYNQHVYTSIVRFFSFQSTKKTGSVIKIRIDENRPESPVYFGGKNFYFYFTFVLYGILIAALIGYALDYYLSAGLG